MRNINIILISLGLAIITNPGYTLNPVYSAQATSDFNPTNFGSGTQNGNNNNSSNQNDNNGHNNNYNNNGYNSNRNNTSNDNNQFATVSANSNNGSYSSNGPNNSGPNNGGFDNNNNSQVPNSNNNWNNNGYNNQSNNWNSTQNNGNYNNAAPNAFTENYALKGKQFGATVFRKDRNNLLYKTNLNANDLQRAIIIFFGDWCPHCSRFLKNFSKSIPALTQAGLKIIFIGVPSVDRLQNWRDPTESDYNENMQKLNGFGVQMGNNMELVLLGNSNSLRDNAVDSLPTMMAISNGKECFRGGADNSIERAEFKNNDEVNQFLQVFNSFGISNNIGSNVRLITTKHSNIQKSGNTNDRNQKSHLGVDVNRANMYTDMLNEGCSMSCNRKLWTPPVNVRYYNSQTQYSCPPCPPCPPCPVCPKCATPVGSVEYQQAESTDDWSSMKIPSSRTLEKCTTCGCIFRRAFSKKCYKDNKKTKCRRVKCCRNKTN